jgi:hypothetical protein
MSKAKKQSTKSLKSKTTRRAAARKKPAKPVCPVEATARRQFTLWEAYNVAAERNDEATSVGLVQDAGDSNLVMVAKARGVKLGGPKIAEARAKATTARIQSAQQRAENVRPIIDQIMRAGEKSLRAIAAALTARGIRTARGLTRWHAEQVAAILRLTGGLGDLALDGHKGHGCLLSRGIPPPIGKNSFHVVGLDERGAIVLRQKWSRGQVEARFANLPHCLIGMEACVGAHHLSRRCVTGQTAYGYQQSGVEIDEDAGILGR